MLITSAFDYSAHIVSDVSGVALLLLEFVLFPAANQVGAARAPRLFRPSLILFGECASKNSGQTRGSRAGRASQ